MKILLLILAALTIGYITAQPRQMRCIQDYKCVHASHCTSTSDIVYPCNENQNRVCCPPDLLAENATIVIRTSAFPKSCGIVSTTDRITGGEIATVGQFPWMALLGYILQGVDLAQFLCAGSIISHKYILTAAHCINIDSRFKLEIVRLGELNLETAPDCDTEGKNKFCADPHVDLAVDKTIPHGSFNNSGALENDIALVKIKGRISFTGFIQPICLPFLNDIDYETIVNNKLTVSGWGKLNAGELGGSTKLMYAQVTVWDQNLCNNSVPPKIRPIRQSQLCANGATRQDACKGDSGGPLTNITVTDDLRNYQIGIVSYGSALICGNPELPTIYTRVDFYLDWIVDNVK